jgi:hypothetical protein
MISKNFFKKCCFLFFAAGSGSLAYNVCASERPDFSDDSPNVRTAYLVQKIDFHRVDGKIKTSSVTLMAKASEGAGSLLASDTIDRIYPKAGLVFKSVPYCKTRNCLAYEKESFWVGAPCYESAQQGTSFFVRNPAAGQQFLIPHPALTWSILSETAEKSTDSSQKEQLTSLMHDLLDDIYVSTPKSLINLIHGRRGAIFYYASCTETLDGVQSSYRVNPARANFHLDPKCSLPKRSPKFLDCGQVLISKENTSYTDQEYLIVSEAFKALANIKQPDFVTKTKESQQECLRASALDHIFCMTFCNVLAKNDVFLPEYKYQGTLTLEKTKAILEDLFPG